MKFEIITLKNGKNVKIEHNYLVIQYIESEFPEGVKELQKKINLMKINKKTNEYIKLSNVLISSYIRANYDDEELTMKQTIRLLDENNYKKVIKFIENQQKNMEEYKKKETLKNKKNHKK